MVVMKVCQNKILKSLLYLFAGRDLNVLIYIRRRIAMCCRKLKKYKEAVKMFRDVSLGILNYIVEYGLFLSK